MPYIQNSDEDQKAMLAEIGLSSLDGLFTSIPEEIRLQKAMDIRAGLTESELKSALQTHADANRPAGKGPCFLGGGSYWHDWPALVDSIASRGEFLTAYTPYQPECSQGTLQAVFEFQTMIAEICGCEVANASMYDGASAVAEAALMAVNITRRQKVVVSAGVHPDARATLATYLKHLDVELVEAPLLNGATDWSLDPDNETAAVIVQQPNFLGVIEDLDAASTAAKDCGALSVCSFYPVSAGLLRSPGEADFDIVVGDGQSLGVPLGFGGPYFGFFATRMKYVRKMPGRLVGQSEDTEGKRAFTLTFATREQHIRREKATSNICTNNALIALRGCIHMAALGPQGLEEVACVSRQRALELAAALTTSNDQISLAFPGQAFFNEVAFKAEGGDRDVLRLQRGLADAGIAGVLSMSRWYDDLAGVFTLACTECIQPQDITALVDVANQVLQMEVAS